MGRAGGADASQRHNRGNNRDDVAHSRNPMARRINHGKSRPAGEFAKHAVQVIVPPERLRLTRLQIVWAETVGPRLSAVAWPGALRGKQLVVFVRDTQWQHELVYMKDQLLQRLSEACKDCPVTSMRFRVGEIPPPVPEAPPPPPPDIVELPSEPAPDTVDALGRVDDEGLRKLMANARMALSGQLRR